MLAPVIARVRIRSGAGIRLWRVGQHKCKVTLADNLVSYASDAMGFADLAAQLDELYFEA